MRWGRLGERNMGMKHVLLAISIWTKPVGKLFLWVPNNIIGSALVLFISFVLLMLASETKDWQHLMESGFGEGMHQALQCNLPSYLNWACQQNWYAKKKKKSIKIDQWHNQKFLWLATSFLENYPIRHQQAAFTLHQMVCLPNKCCMIFFCCCCCWFFFFFFTVVKFPVFPLTSLQQISPQILFRSDNMSRKLIQKWYSFDNNLLHWSFADQKTCIEFKWTRQLL